MSQVCTVIAVPTAARRGHQIPCWTVVSHPTWKLGTELGASRTATRALNHSTNSPAAPPTKKLHFKSSLKWSCLISDFFLEIKGSLLVSVTFKILMPPFFHARWEAAGMAGLIRPLCWFQLGWLIWRLIFVCKSRDYCGSEDSKMGKREVWHCLQAG